MKKALALIAVVVIATTAYAQRRPVITESRNKPRRPVITESVSYEQRQACCLLLRIGHRDFDNRYQRNDPVLLSVLAQIVKNQELMMDLLRDRERDRVPGVPLVPQTAPQQSPPVVIVYPERPQQQLPQLPPIQILPQLPPQQQLPQQPPQQQLPQNPPQQAPPQTPPQQGLPQGGPQQGLQQGEPPQMPPVTGFESFAQYGARVKVTRLRTRPAR